MAHVPALGEPVTVRGNLSVEAITLDRVRRALSHRKGADLDSAKHTQAAVTVLIYPKDGHYTLLLNRRSQQVDHHKGEMAFPGGSKDPQDSDLLATALRETWEEMGVRPEDVTVLGELDGVVTGTGFAVQAFVGTIPYPYPFRASAKEVEEVVEIPLSALLDPKSRREEVRLLGDGSLVREFSYAYNGCLVYGATAKILTQFLGLLSQGLRR